MPVNTERKVYLFFQYPAQGSSLCPKQCTPLIYLFTDTGRNRVL